MGSGWNKSCEGIRIYSIPKPWQTPVAATTVYNTPDDGRKLRPKHVE